MNKLLIGLVTAVVTLGVVLGTLIATKGHPTRQEKPIKQETKTEKNYTEVDLNTLMTELKENALNAAEKYKGKDVKIVHGVLKNIDSDGDYISLNGDQNKLNIVHNMMVMTKSKEVKDQVRQLKVGQSLIIYGHIDDVGEVIGYKVHADKIEIAAEQSAATPTPAAEMRRMEDMPLPAQLKQNQRKATAANTNSQEMGYWYVPYAFPTDGPISNGVQTSYVPLARTMIPTKNQEFMRDFGSGGKFYFIHGATSVSQDGTKAVYWIQVETDILIERVAVWYDDTTKTQQFLGMLGLPFNLAADRYRPNHEFEVFSGLGEPYNLWDKENKDLVIILLGIIAEEMNYARQHGKLYKISPGSLLVN